MRLHCLCIVATLFVAACTPRFDPATYLTLSQISAQARDMADRCPDLTIDEIHRDLVLRAEVAAEQENGRKYAEDLTVALGALVNSVRGMERIYAGEARPSQFYCIEKLNLIVAEVGRIKAAFAKVEHGNTPFSN